MRMTPTSKRPCDLERGEMRRVPQDQSRGLVGYHVGCPRCGFVTVALEGDRGLAITEAGQGQAISFSRPLRCMFCQVLMHVHRSRARLKEDDRVRPIGNR